MRTYALSDRGMRVVVSFHEACAEKFRAENPGVTVLVVPECDYAECVEITNYEKGARG